MSKQTQANNQLYLVAFKRELFPLRVNDLSLMKERGFTTSRISADAFEVLKTVFLKGVNISVLPWPEVYTRLLLRLQEVLPEPMYTFDSNGPIVVIHMDSIEREDRALLGRHLSSLQTYAGRYGFRVRIDDKVREDHILTRLTFAVDSNIIPAFYFGEDHQPPPELELKWNVTPSCRLRFTKKMSSIKQPLFKVALEERGAEVWLESFARAFNFSHIKPEECKKAINFFMDLNSQIEASIRDAEPEAKAQ